MHIKQTPAPDTRQIAYRGDTVTFILALDENISGEAWLRTNIGRGHIRNEEIIRYAEEGLPPLARDWHDFPMTRKEQGLYSITLSLVEVGRFEAKAFFRANDQDDILWPPGGNSIIKVEPAETAAGNTMYTAFVRQFGEDKKHAFSSDPHSDAATELDTAGYTVIPRSGKFRELIAELDFITETLRCRIIQLLPIFPTPTTYAKMGRFGSPFAAMDLFDVDPALAEFDKQTTPLQQFQELADEVHRRDARLFLDLPINHTGWASHLQIHHPQWFVRNDDDTFMSPGAWGIVWGDLSELDYSHRDLQKYMAEVFLFWCSHGADGFRLDAGYKIPFRVWRYIVARVRNQYPDTVFMLEGLGGDPKITEKLLADSGIDWAYSELFQNYTKEQIEYYLPEADRISSTAGTLIHFSETHDNNRLALISRSFARLRTALCALASDTGAFGFTNGVEWYAAEKIHVHGNTALNWGAEVNMAGFIARLHAILETHPSFFPGGKKKSMRAQADNAFSLLRADEEDRHPLLVLANLDTKRSKVLSWPAMFSKSPSDLLTGRKFSLKKGPVQEAVLAPGEVLALSEDKKALADVEHALKSAPMFSRNKEQVLKAKALEIYASTHGTEALPPEKTSPTDLARCLSENPIQFLQSCAGVSFPRIVLWRWPVDKRRAVMIPPEHFIYIAAPYPFTAVIKQKDEIVRFERSIRRSNGAHFSLIKPIDPPDSHEELGLGLTVFEPQRVRHADASLLLLSEGKDAKIACTHNVEGFDKADRYAIAANPMGAMTQARMGWADIRSKYDALLAGNLNDRCPSDRRVMLTRMRAWLICRGYSSALNLDSQKRFSVFEDDSIVWRFSVPAGQGFLAAIKIVLKMDAAKNRITVDIHRLPEDGRSYRGPDDVPAEIILRPDIEDRVSHDVTKAYTGPEHTWPTQITAFPDGFVFSPARDRHLHLCASKGTYSDEKEWIYQVDHAEDAERGMDPLGDLLSPGYFRIPLKGGESATVSAEISQTAYRPKAPVSPSKIPEKRISFLHVQEAARRALSAFIVNRDEFKTVIAGYPWFLDWGRDTLIALRGIISDGRSDEAKSILLQFAKFEQNGTLPNMIRGEDHSNRETSDAPLFFFVAVSDLIEKEQSNAFLDADTGGRTVKEVLLSIVRGYINGTPNGIRMDPDSGLIFSPSHFTWMDTNYPAGTPREGYPVEIQALWILALRFSARLDKKGGFAARAKQAEQSLKRLFVVETGEMKFLADCLRAAPGVSAAHGVQDDALRPNQLLAVTLGAVTDKPLCRAILSACETLLIPGGARSLADKEVRCESPIWWNDKLLNNPGRPYIGRYSGDEDTKRKPAYHNGTAWTWTFPSYSEALAMTYEDGTKNEDMAKRAALSILSSAAVPFNRGCMLHLPEVMDGDAPHAPKGCGAQAWGVSELYRVWKKIERRD